MFMISKVRLQTTIMSSQLMNLEAILYQNLRSKVNSNKINIMLSCLKWKPSNIKVEDNITHQLTILLNIVLKRVLYNNRWHSIFKCSSLNAYLKESRKQLISWPKKHGQKAKIISVASSYIYTKPPQKFKPKNIIEYDLAQTLKSE